MKETILATVGRKFFPKGSASFNGFWAGELFANKVKIRASGNVDLIPNATYLVTGSFDDDPKWGKQFKFDQAQISNSLDNSGLIKLLTTDKAFNGVGNVKAKILVEKHGESIFNKISSTPLMELVEYPVTEKDLMRIKSAYSFNKDYYDFAAKIIPYGATIKIVRELNVKHGSKAFEKLKENPYSELLSVKGIGFKTADTIAINMGVDLNSLDRVKEGIIHLLNEESADGHIWELKEAILNKATQILSVRDNEILNKACNELEKEQRIKDLGEGVVAETSLYESEMYISKIIDEYGKQNNISEAMRMISDDNESEYYKTLNKKQRMAIEIARSERMMVLTGPAGTGKTYVIKSILREYQKNKVSFALCAPTGKAARRIESVVFEKAQTIHKLLDCRGLSDDGNVDFEYNERNKLDFGVIIVDEISMADSRLVCHLFKAIDFEKTNIIFVGDHNQLPPVGPGNYLRDMLETNKIKSVVLDEVVRQAGDLQKNSTNVLSGEVSRQKTKDWMVCDSMDNEEDVQNMVLKVYNHYLEAGFEANEIQVVSPMYKGMAGVANLNTTLRAAYLMRKGILVEDDFFKVMDKVICTKNDYNLGIMNGMTGKVISADKVSKIIEVRFDDNKDIIKIEGEDIKMISYAYALTVHKVQGDQIPIVISVIQKSHDHMFKSLGRNLLYTAVTRAQKTSIIVGDRFTIDDTARINNIHKRRTLLSLL